MTQGRGGDKEARSRDGAPERADLQRHATGLREAEGADQHGMALGRELDVRPDEGLAQRLAVDLRLLQRCPLGRCVDDTCRKTVSTVSIVSSAHFPQNQASRPPLRADDP